jgi:hypothetical protein
MWLISSQDTIYEMLYFTFQSFFKMYNQPLPVNQFVLNQIIPTMLRDV